MCFVFPERYYFRGDRTKAVNKSYWQMFLEFLFYFMIDKSLKKISFFYINLFSLSSLYRSSKIQSFLLEFTWSLLVIWTDYQRKRKFMLISIKTSHRCLASRMRFIHVLKMFTAYIGKFDIFPQIINSNKNESNTMFLKPKITKLSTIDICHLFLRWVPLS